MSRQPGSNLSPQKSLRRASVFAPAPGSSKSIPELPRSESNRTLGPSSAGMGPSTLSPAKPPRPADPYSKGHQQQQSASSYQKQRSGLSVDSTMSKKSAMDRRKSRVDGLLRQKRGSISYGSAEAQGMLPGQPSLPPPLPSGDHGTLSLKPSRRERTPAATLEDELFAEDFDADACVSFCLDAGLPLLIHG